MDLLIQKQLNGRNHVMPKRIDEETRKKLLQKYDRNEDNNYHTENYLLLAETYGTPQEVAQVKKILKRRGELGSLDNNDYVWLRDSGINDYYQNLTIPIDPRVLKDNPFDKFSDEKLWLFYNHLKANSSEADPKNRKPGQPGDLDNILYWVNETNATPAKKKKARDLVRRAWINNNTIRKDNGDYDWWIKNISRETSFLLDPEIQKRIANYDAKMDKETFRANALHDVQYSKLFEVRYGHFPTEHSIFDNEKPPLIAPRPKPKPTIKKTKTIKSYSEKRTPKIGKTINRRTLM